VFYRGSVKARKVEKKRELTQQEHQNFSEQPSGNFLLPCWIPLF